MLKTLEIRLGWPQFYYRKPKTENRKPGMAEGVGFEPTDLSVCGFQDRRLRPLGHPSPQHLLPSRRVNVNVGGLKWGGRRRNGETEKRRKERCGEAEKRGKSNLMIYIANLFSSGSHFLWPQALACAHASLFFRARQAVPPPMPPKILCPSMKKRVYSLSPLLRFPVSFFSPSPPNH